MNSNDFKEQLSSDKTDTINRRFYQRNIPSDSLQPYFSTRPVSTKYSYMPIIDPKKKQTKVLVDQKCTYNISKTFNPGSGKGPWSGYSSNVNDESILRNQIYAIQSSSQSVYIPDSRSDLYKFSWKPNHSIKQPFPNLFSNDTLNLFDPNPNSNLIGYSLFNNFTRQQNKEL